MASRDLVAVTDVALSQGFSVALVEQPYRVAGRRSPAPAPQLDAAWTAVVDHLRAGELHGLPLVVGGRSLGARVACRTAAATGAVGVLCLAFPLQPPRRSGRPPAESRLPELEAVEVPMLVVQGSRDPFGIPPAGATRTVVEVPGNHSLRTDLDAVAAAVRDWLPRVVDRGPGTTSRDRDGRNMATKKQRETARKNVKKAQSGARRKKSIAKLPKKTRTALGREGAKAAARKRGASKGTGSGAGAMTVTELRREAAKLGIDGRSKMGKAQLIRAVGQKRRSRSS